MAASLEPMGDSVYAATKAGLSTLANVMAKEFGAMNVTCNTLGVTAIDSDMLAQLPRDKIEAIIAGLPVPRFATDADILNVVDFFASEAIGYITAQTVFLGGVN
jgi:3-oxoacyl-[acyl-carrier protein] reductase